MPIYEFYCGRCNTFYSFLSRKVNPKSSPACPACRTATLERRVSMFAAPSGGARDAEEGQGVPGEGAGGPDVPVDDARMERAVESLAGEAEGLDEDDPRQAANLMRKFAGMTGMEYGPAMREALARMDAGEDPDAIESELGARIEQEEPFLAPGGAKAGSALAKARRRPPPKRDETLYEM